MTTIQNSQTAATDEARTVYRNMTDQDLGALYLYIHSLPASP